MTNAELIETLRYCFDKRKMVAGVPLHVWCDRAADALEDAEKRIAELEAQLPKEGEWIMDEDPHDGDCRCSVCLIAIDAMHERNHGLLNALTGGKWWKFYRYCPNCGAKMKVEQE